MTQISDPLSAGNVESGTESSASPSRIQILLFIVTLIRVLNKGSAISWGSNADRTAITVSNRTGGKLG